MKITLVSVGAVKKPGIREAVEDYVKRIKRYSPVEAVEIKEERSVLPKEEVLRREGERILKKLEGADYRVVLADSGKEATSLELAGLISKLQDRGVKNLAFVIGGAWGLHEEVYESASQVLSLSRMTLPHDLARLVLAEQVYRAFTIIKGEPYSH